MGNITRRDFVNGTLVAAGASVLPIGCKRAADLDELDSLDYPPSRTGLRGSHPGSNTYAHTKAGIDQSHWGSPTELSESYDLVVVGGGISGLAAAYFYQREHGREKKVLVLDNHDDFGGACEAQ